MKKVNNQINAKAQAYTESKSLRDEAVQTANVDFLDKIKAVQYLTDDMCLSMEQIANYYETSNNTVKTIISRNRDEFESDGMVILKGQELKEFKKKYLQNDLVSNETESINIRTPSLTLLTKRSLLRIGLIMTNNAMATRIRNYLLNLEECATVDQKSWAIQREVSIIERKRMTSAIFKYLPNSPHKRFAYPNYTNMLYKILFNKDAKLLRLEKKVDNNDLLRDSFDKDELSKVEEGETIITALLALGFEYKQIEEQLKNKFIKSLKGEN